MIDETAVKLRRTLRPYLGQTAILAGLTVFLFYAAVTKSGWELFWAGMLIWPFFAAYVVFFGMKYRILWNSECVIMRASGGPERRIRFDEITEIRKEVGQPSEFLAQARPFRRIAVYGRKHDPNARIDVSLRHFQLRDIEQLLTKIRQLRPDLKVPTVAPDRLHH